MQILPTIGIVNLKDLAEVMHTDPATLDQKLGEMNITIMRLGSRHHAKFVSLEQINEWLSVNHVGTNHDNTRI